MKKIPVLTAITILALCISGCYVGVGKPIPANKDASASLPQTASVSETEAPAVETNDFEQRDRIILKAYDEYLSRDEIVWDKNGIYPSGEYEFDIIRAGKSEYPVLFLSTSMTCRAQGYNKAVVYYDGKVRELLNGIGLWGLYPSAGMFIGHSSFCSMGESNTEYDLFDEETKSAIFWGYSSVLSEETIAYLNEENMFDPFAYYYLSDSSLARDCTELTIEEWTEITKGNTTEENFESKFSSIIGDEEEVFPDLYPNTPENRNHVMKLIMGEDDSDWVDTRKDLPRL